MFEWIYITVFIIPAAVVFSALGLPLAIPFLT